MASAAAAPAAAAVPAAWVVPRGNSTRIAVAFVYRVSVILALRLMRHGTPSPSEIYEELAGVLKVFVDAYATETQMRVSFTRARDVASALFPMLPHVADALRDDPGCRVDRLASLGVTWMLAYMSAIMPFSEALRLGAQCIPLHKLKERVTAKLARHPRVIEWTGSTLVGGALGALPVPHLSEDEMLPTEAEAAELIEAM